jgi:ABC-type Na+ efflux pump permease subunit
MAFSTIGIIILISLCVCLVIGVITVNKVINRKKQYQQKIIKYTSDISIPESEYTNISPGLKIIIESANKGDKDAANKLGYIYKEGKYDIRVNLNQAYEYFDIANNTREKEKIFGIDYTDIKVEMTTLDQVVMVHNGS